MVAAAHNANQCISGRLVAASKNVKMCQAATLNVKAANAVYMRSLRDRNNTDIPMAKISKAARRADTA